MIRTNPELCLKIVGVLNNQDVSDCDILDDFIFGEDEAYTIRERLSLDPEYRQYSQIVVEPSTVHM